MKTLNKLINFLFIHFRLLQSINQSLKKLKFQKNNPEKLKNNNIYKEIKDKSNKNKSNFSIKFSENPILLLPLTVFRLHSGFAPYSVVLLFKNLENK